ncbi:helix-turn-helix domain-containing protein [Streptomyces sp. NBC_01242]|uniref:helix-turn-helix domain-containing protein n=1 Tax=Streptomyces sp. NBC_01242 TaxID=2903795 RepID=UPI00225AA757|nr:helix-turn-helix transcriptional regulator [Streptomyces sp. NBC_01242]MCX4799690.1 helix-turn-helix domain-containing protein [Streptomyces sp. NBC_01242]
MSNVIASISHPYWASLGRAVREGRTSKGLSQMKVAGFVGISVRDLAALESGFVPPEVVDNLSRATVDAFDEALGWEEGTARKHVTEAVSAASTPSSFTLTKSNVGLDRSTYSRDAWIRLGKAVQAARMALKMTKPVLAYAIQSTGKTILRLEDGLVYGDPRTAPPANYNSEKYMLKRLALLEMALEWEEGQARQILEGKTS